MNIQKWIICVTLSFLSGCATDDKPIKIQFRTEPCLIPTKDNKFKLCDNLIVQVNHHFHVAPRGFKTDLASIPRILWPIFSPEAFDSIAPAVLHDWHYCCDSEITRKHSDEIFYYSLLAQGSSKMKASLYYWGVRSVGWMFFLHGTGAALHEGEYPPDELQGTYKYAAIGLDEIP